MENQDKLINNPDKIQEQLAEVFGWDNTTSTTPEHEQELLEHIQVAVWEHELAPFTPEEQKLLDSTK